MSCGIYTITNTVNNKLYVGLSINVENRWAEHVSSLNRQKHENSKLQRAWNKYGESSFLHEVLVECGECYLYSEEHYWCNLLQVHNDKYGYNIRPTHPEGRGGISEESRKKLSEAQKQVWKGDVERSKKQSERMKGKQYGKGHVVTVENRNKINEGKKNAYYSPEARKGMGHMKDKTHNEESRRKISNAHKGRKNTQKQIEAVRERSVGNKWNVGRKHTAEAIEKMKVAQKARINSPDYVHPNTGKNLSPETIAKIIAANTGRKLPNAKNVNRKAVICYNEDGSEYQKFKSLTDAVEHFGSHYKQGVKLSRAIRNNKQWKNKNWQYENTNN